MEHLKTGSFFGQINKTLHLDAITLSDIDYTLDKVDWHYHQDAYFALVLTGQILEVNKKQQYHCTAGTLLFHNWQDPHYNIKSQNFTKGFHVEIKDSWLKQNLSDKQTVEGSYNIQNPEIKILFHHIYKESQLRDESSILAIPEILIRIFVLMHRLPSSKGAHRPLWINKLIDILHSSEPENTSLEYLSRELNIHPVHLCRDFPKYFHCTLGDYLRKIKLEKSLTLLANKNNSLTEIAFYCGFSDQSHFTRCFKGVNKMTPSQYRHILMSQGSTVR